MNNHKLVVNFHLKITRKKKTKAFKILYSYFSHSIISIITKKNKKIKFSSSKIFYQYKLVEEKIHCKLEIKHRRNGEIIIPNKRLKSVFSVCIHRN